MMRNGSTNYRHKLFGALLNDGQVVGRIFKHSQESRGSGQSLLASIRRRHTVAAIQRQASKR